MVLNCKKTNSLKKCAVIQRIFFVKKFLFSVQDAAKCFIFEKLISTVQDKSFSKNIF
jgi:hypothetical protein